MSVYFPLTWSIVQILDLLLQNKSFSADEVGVVDGKRQAHAESTQAHKVPERELPRIESKSDLSPKPSLFLSRRTNAQTGEVGSSKPLTGTVHDPSLQHQASLQQTPGALNGKIASAPLVYRAGWDSDVGGLSPEVRAAQTVQPEKLKDELGKDLYQVRI